MSRFLDKYKYFLVKPIKIYCICNGLNMLIHIMNYYMGFLGFGADILLYLFKIGVCYYVYLQIKHKGNENHAIISSVIKYIMIADALELFVSVTAVEIKGLVFAILLLLFCLKAYLDYYLFLILCKSEPAKKMWTILNSSIVIFVVLVSITNQIMYVVYILLLIRFLMANSIVKRTEGSIPFIKKNAVIVKLSNVSVSHKSRYYIWGAVGILAVCFLWLRYSKATGKYELVSDDGSIVVYSSMDYFVEDNYGIDRFCITNRMPDWTGFSRYWWGFIDEQSGNVTQAQYSNAPCFDESGIAWDYDGHFIDAKGNIVIDVSSLVMNRRAPRTTIINDFLDVAWESEDFLRVFKWISIRTFHKDVNPSYGHDHFYVEWQGQSVYEGNVMNLENVWGLGHYDKDLYFINNVAAFYSEKDGAYGLINDKGEVIIKPSIYRIDISKKAELIYVTLKGKGYLNIVNYDGVFLLDRTKDWYLKEYDDDTRTAWYTHDFSADGDVVISYDGQVIEE